MMEKSQKNQKQKNLSKDTQRGLFHYRVKFLICALLGASPKPQKQEQKQKMALASLVSFQKQKLIVVKIFMKLDIEKAVFQRGNKRTFFMPLVDTRSLIQYKTNIITYGKKHDSILAYADAP